MINAAPYDVLFEDRSHDDDLLPTPNDINGSESVLNQSPGFRVVRIGKAFIIKFSFNVYPTEAYNMLYVVKSTTMPVPKVYAIY